MEILSIMKSIMEYCIPDILPLKPKIVCFIPFKHDLYKLHYATTTLILETGISEQKSVGQSANQRHSQAKWIVKCNRKPPPAKNSLPH